MLDSYIKELKSDNAPVKPELARALVDVYESASELDKMLTEAQETGGLKVAVARRVLTKLQSDLEDAEAKLKGPRLNEDTREQVPTGINKLLRQLQRVTVEIANASVHASKAERITLRELIQSYHDSFPYDELKQALEAHIVQVRTQRTSQRLGTDAVADKAVQKLSQSYSRYYNALPNNLRGLPYKAFKMPVASLYAVQTKTFDVPDRLRRAGFDVTSIGDAYYIIEDQFIIAFDHKEMGIDSGVRMKEGKFKVTKLSGPKREIARTEATAKLIDLIETINEKFGVHYALASTMFVPNPRNPKIWLAWVVTENQRKKLANALDSVEVNWDLPFSPHEDE